MANCRNLLLLLLLTACSAHENTVSLIKDSLSVVQLRLDTKDSIQWGVRLKGNDNPLILGDYSLHETHQIFTPAMRFAEGQSYEVLVEDSIWSSFSIPIRHLEAINDLSIYPSTDTIPMNLLKVIFQFDHPMNRSRSFDFIQWYQEGDSIGTPFLELRTELWNEEHTSLTLWLDPGRIKQGLIPNLRDGNPLTEYMHYELEVSDEWKDIHGHKLTKSVNKHFYISSRDSTKIDLSNWSLQKPLAGTTGALSVNFGESLDFHLIQTGINIFTKDSTYLKGDFIPLNFENGINFLPASSWSIGSYLIRVDAKIEDLAGNNLNRAFDRKINEVEAPEVQYYWLPFKIVEN